MQGIYSTDKYIDLQDAVSLLGVSSATVRNWVKSNYLTPEKTVGKKMMFDWHKLNILKDKISSGQIDRLNSRANKKNSSGTFIPDEYAENAEVIQFVEWLLDCYSKHSLNRNMVLLVTALSQLKQVGLVEYTTLNNFNDLKFKNETVKNEIQWWIRKVQGVNHNAHADIFSMKAPLVGDLLGLTYQSLVAEGEKAQAGSYYTPRQVVDSIIEEHIKHDFTVLDPCCGTGQFLLSASKKIKDPNKIWGFDVDETAVQLARINLLLQFPLVDFTPHIYTKNSLLQSNSGTLFSQDTTPLFDAIITNPPWGVHFSDIENTQLRDLYPEVTSGEAFSYFIKKSLTLLKENGTLSFILPEAILNIKTHRDIRKVLLEKTQINKIMYLDRVFKNVFTPVIRLDVKNVSPKNLNKIRAEKNGSVYEIEQLRLVDNSDYIFNVFTDNTDVALFDKVYALNHTTLKDKAEWALGVVTGDNKKHLMQEKIANTEPILTGKEVKKFLACGAKNFINFQPANFQQVAPVVKYRAKEKLIYKFIAKELVFSYDDKQTLTLNSANILIPQVESYSVKTILALFNSSLYQFLYQKKFGAIKVLRSDLEKLPLPIIDERQHSEIQHWVDELLREELDEGKRKELYLKLDDHIMNLFNLEEKEKDYIRKSIKVSDKLLRLE